MSKYDHRIFRLEELRRIILRNGDKYGLCLLQSFARIHLLDWLAITKKAEPEEKYSPYWFSRDEEGKQKRLALVDQVLVELRERNN